MSIEKAKELLQDARRLAFKGKVVQLIDQALTELDKPDTRIAAKIKALHKKHIELRRRSED